MEGRTLNEKERLRQKPETALRPSKPSPQLEYNGGDLVSNFPARYVLGSVGLPFHFT